MIAMTAAKLSARRRRRAHIGGVMNIRPSVLAGEK